eukprot:gene7509-8939_t
MATSAEVQPPRKLVLVVAAALLNSEGEVLLAQIDPGETPEGALVRELREELTGRDKQLIMKESGLAKAILVLKSEMHALVTAVEVEEQNLLPLTFASHAYDR